MGKIQKIVDKLHLDRYFSSRLILAIDLFVSLSVSICSLMFIKMLLFKSLVTVDFILVWLSASLVMSFVMFYRLKTYRSIIRHSTLREFAKLCLASAGKVLLMGILVRVVMIVMYDILRTKVREYEYEEAKTLVSDLGVLSRKVNIPDMIRLMKKNVPEYISKELEVRAVRFS